MIKPKLAITLIPLLLLGLIFYYFTSKKSSITQITVPISEKHRGVCWVGSRQAVTTGQIEALVKNNINWISQTPFGWQREHDNPQIGTNRDLESTAGQVYWGERDEGIRSTTKMARNVGIKTILKPHIWLRDSNGKWRGEIKMKSEEDWKLWFQEYSGFILHYAQLAQEEQIEMLCIGTELHQTCVEREQDWRKLIAQVRLVYSGSITYAANFSDEFKDVPFWDALDLIGIQAYFPVAQSNSPSLKEIKKGWQKPIEELAAFSKKYQKPILFTEVGYKSTKDAGVEPWTWPQQRLGAEERKMIFSEETQANLYEALFSEVGDQPWLAGFHFWKWFPNYGSRTSNTDFNIDFTPQGKAAEKVMSTWFNKIKND